MYIMLYSNFGPRHPSLQPPAAPDVSKRFFRVIGLNIVALVFFFDSAVVRSSESRRSIVIFPRWAPVADWSDAGADVSFADRSPDRQPQWEEARDALVALGRPIHVPHYGGFTTHFGYSGTLLTGYFSGATPVTNEVISWLRDELRRLFGNLPRAMGHLPFDSD